MTTLELFSDLKEKDEQLILYAARHYQLIGTGDKVVKQFERDLNRITYIRKLFNRSKSREPLILNHIIILQNMFGITPTVTMLRHKVETHHHLKLNAFFRYLDSVPEDTMYDLHTYERIRQIEKPKG